LRSYIRAELVLPPRDGRLPLDFLVLERVVTVDNRRFEGWHAGNRDICLLLSLIRALTAIAQAAWYDQRSNCSLLMRAWHSSALLPPAHREWTTPRLRFLRAFTYRIRRAATIHYLRVERRRGKRPSRLELTVNAPVLQHRSFIRVRGQTFMRM